MFKMLMFITLFLGVSNACCETFYQVNTDYPGVEHHVVTNDGYILGLQRIPYGRNSSLSIRKVVLLMHGFSVGSDSFTYAGRDYAIGYNLADAGFDVWMGNDRGNSFSRRHVYLDPDKDKYRFFDFNYEDMALLDLPAIIDYILDQTQQEKLYYIGHSQGGTIFFVLNSMSTAYHSKIASAHILAGIGYPNNLPNVNMKILSKSIDVIYSALLLSGNVEMVLSNLSLAVTEIIVGVKVSPNVFRGASIKQLVHFCQNIRDKRFSRYNFGSVKNVEKYGSIIPPAYNLTKINIDVTLHYSVGDITQSEKDVLEMAKAIPRAKARRVARDSFNHLDFLGAKDAKELVTNYVIKSIKNSY